MLVFTPEICGEGRDPLAVLAAALPSIDLVQVRVKSGAADLRRWTLDVLEVVDAMGGRVPVIVNDRVDVAATLIERGVAGVHLGDRDLPVEEARELLGPELLVGLSTHSPADVARAARLPVDYLGFGPIHPTPTKGYERGLGAEAAWVASTGAPCPLFPIGGIDETNASELQPVGRAAVAAAILAADDPARAAASLRELLC
ncbi:MAG: thiamine phosphate synthase [Planctomycetota bacterium]|nr:thiamine phosphate synthase [Planctomycetota bacterium]